MLDFDWPTHAALWRKRSISRYTIKGFIWGLVLTRLKLGRHYQPISEVWVFRSARIGGGGRRKPKPTGGQSARHKTICSPGLLRGATECRIYWAGFSTSVGSEGIRSFHRVLRLFPVFWENGKTDEWKKKLHSGWNLKNRLPRRSIQSRNRASSGCLLQCLFHHQTFWIPQVQGSK